ncbi:MAG: peptidoglycan DD-metalloendopeptidase family protein [Bacteroidota bacterium]
MTHYLIYLLEVSLCTALFWGFYLLFLRKLTFFSMRRFYLLLTLFLSWLLPLSNFSLTHHEGNHPMHNMGDFVYALEQGMVEEVENLSLIPTQQALESHASHVPGLSLGNVLNFLYFLGLLFFAGKLVLGLKDVVRLFAQTSWQRKNGYWEGSTQLPYSFSFGPMLFLSQKDISLPKSDRQTLYWHEEAHIRQAHTIDIILVKIQQIIIWFNPIYGWAFNELKFLHECSADRAVTNKTHKHQYAQFLLDQSISSPQKALIHAFAQVHLKERIQTIFSPSSSRWNLFWLIPACLLGFFLSVGFSFIRQSEEIPFELHTMLQELKQQIPPELSPGFQFLESIQPDFLLRWDDYSIPHLSPIERPIVSSTYGEKIDPYTGEKNFHKGMDFKAASGTPVYATGDGVIFAAPNGFGFKEQGWFVQIHHGEGLYSYYANLMWDKSIDSLSQENRAVKAGDIIGYVGNSNPNSTGPHLHYEVGTKDCTYNPIKFLPHKLVPNLPSAKSNTISPEISQEHLLPIKGGKFYSGFGMRMHPVMKTRKMHFGVDFEAKLKTEVLATASGKVILAKRSGAYGYRIDIDHGDGFKTLYAHLHQEGILVKAGEQVEAGQLIAYSGNSGLSKGPHLHYELRKEGKPVNPMDYFTERPLHVSDNGSLD